MREDFCVEVECKGSFASLGLDKAEWLEDIRKGSCSLKSFLGVAGEGIDERESSKFEEGLS